MAFLSTYWLSLLILGTIFVIAAFLTNRVRVPRGKKGAYIPGYKIGFQRSSLMLGPHIDWLKRSYVNKQLLGMYWPTFWLLMLLSVAWQNGYLSPPVTMGQGHTWWQSLVIWLLAWIFGGVIVSGSSYRAVEEGPGGDSEILTALRSRVAQLSPEMQQRVLGARLPDVRGFARRANRATLLISMLTSIGVMGLVALGIWVSQLTSPWPTLAVVGVFLLDLLLYFGVVMADG